MWQGEALETSLLVGAARVRMLRLFPARLLRAYDTRAPRRARGVDCTMQILLVVCQ